MPSYKTLFPLAFLACLAFLPALAEAGVFSVSPVRMHMAPKDRAIAVTINNEGNDELIMQADVYAWKQSPAGVDELTLTEDLILSPPIVKLAPHSRQVVRLALLSPRSATEQLTYRLVVREVPIAKPAENNIQLQLALAFSLPVFITPSSAKRQLGCSINRVAADTVRADCENTGNAYAQAREFTLLSASGEKLAMRDEGGYILPLIKRSFEIKRAQGPIAAGNARLAVALDDGSTQNFDVIVP